MRRVVRIALLSGALVALGAAAGIGSTGAQQVTASSDGLDCGSDSTVTIVIDSALVPGRRDSTPPTSRQALGRFLRQSGVGVKPSAFARSGGGEGAGLHVHRRDGRKLATAYVQAAEGTFRVTNITACNRLASNNLEEDR